MIPQTRHYVDRAVIYDHFKEHFQDKADFMKSVTSTMWNAHGSEIFSNITWVAGSSFGSLGRASGRWVEPLRLTLRDEDAVALCNFLFPGRIRALATRSVILYHMCHSE